MMITIEVCFLATFNLRSSIRTRGFAIIAMIQPMTKGIKNCKNRIPKRIPRIIPRRVIKNTIILFTYFFSFMKISGSSFAISIEKGCLTQQPLYSRSRSKYITKIQSAVRIWNFFYNPVLNIKLIPGHRGLGSVHSNT